MNFKEALFYLFITISVGAWMILMAINIISLILCKYQYKTYREIKDEPITNSKDAPFVSVLRPLCGLEYKLKQNLESSFLQDYPNFELIFNVKSSEDACIPLVLELIQKYPNIDAKLIIDEDQKGVNPKVSNLLKAYEQSRHDLIWVCDSNIFLNKGCLSRSAKLMMEENVGLVHHLPVGIDGTTFGSQLESMFLNTAHAKMYTLLNYFIFEPCVVGKSCLYRKSDLACVGSMKAFENQLAEDFFIAKAIWDQGLKIKMPYDLAYNRLGSISTSAYFNRRSRWCRLRKYIVPQATIIEPFTESILNGMLASYGFSYLLNISIFNFFAYHLVVWFLLDFQLNQQLIGNKLNLKELQRFMVIWAFRELTALPLYLYSVLGSTFTWRGQTYRITSGSYAVPEDNVSLFHPVFHHPIFLKFIDYLFYSIDFIADILMKSQRNGNPEMEFTPKSSPQSISKPLLETDATSYSSCSHSSYQMGLDSEEELRDIDFPNSK
ncbi:nucleotide-diphospho-sugar transferase [Neoconidiobolus thromboides FSU 785]|nr:nucleotide-diphospho-sugar transferase [Neoconidiobolus thromboides FSU 785]